MENKSVVLIHFLNSSESILKCALSQTHYVKVESEFPEIAYLYHKTWQKEIFNPFKEIEFTGIYCRRTQQLICDSWSLDRMKREILDLSGITLVELSDVQTQAIEQVREQIRLLLPFETETLSGSVQLESYQMKKAKKEAYLHYIYSSEVNTGSYSDLYSVPMQYEAYPLFVQYLLGNEQALLEEAKRFIQEHQVELAETLKYTKAVRWELQEFNQTNQYLERKKMLNSVDDKMKTIRVKINKNGKLFECKVENEFTAENDYISTYYIAQKMDKRVFEELFGRHEEIKLDDIVEISYGRQTLYQRIA